MKPRTLVSPLSLLALLYACGGTVLDTPDADPAPDGGAPIGAACSTPSDCATGLCTNGVCATETSTRPDASPPPPPPATCTDRVRNGAETDVDCGGACPRACELGKACSAARDCVTGICTLGKCVGPSASDGIRNADETDVDCGGLSAPPCAGGKACRAHADCLSAACASGTCLASGPAQATTLSAGTMHTCAILDNGALKCWGDNQYGQLGLGDAQRRGLNAGEMGDALPAVDVGAGRTAKSVACGRAHTCALLDNNAVRCWGGADFLGTSQNVLPFVGDAPGEMGDNLPYVDLGTGRTARAIAAGLSHTCAILDDATLKCWGNNVWGAVGNGTHVSPRGGNQMGDNLLPVNVGAGRTVKAVTAGAYHTCAILDIGSVKCWGLNSDGQLGQGHTLNRGNYPLEMGNNLPAVQLGLGRTAKAISAGGYFTCVLLDDGTVKCWGAGGLLGTGDTRSRGVLPGDMGDNLLPISLGTGRTARAISTGLYSACAILDDNSLKCWGLGTVGDSISRGEEPNQMGDLLPTANLGTARFARTVVSGERYSCAALDNNGIKCWGTNNEGQLGLGALGPHGNEPIQVGDNLLFVNLGTGRTLRLP